MDSRQHEAKPGEVDHWTPYSHWCGDRECWHWVIDCKHMADPLGLPHFPVDDACIRSLAYDRMTQRLEVRYRWRSVRQYRPVPLSVVKQIWKARPMDVALHEYVKASRVRFVEVRSEGKLLMTMMRGWQMIPKANIMPAQ